METQVEPVNQVSHKLNPFHGQNYCCFQIQSYSLCWFPPRLASLFQPLLVVGCAHTQPFLDKITLLFVGLDLSIKQVEKESHRVKCSFNCGPQWVCKTMLRDWLRKLLLYSQKKSYSVTRVFRVWGSVHVSTFNSDWLLVLYTKVLIGSLCSIPKFWSAPCALHLSSDWLLVLYT